MTMTTDKTNPPHFFKEELLMAGLECGKQVAGLAIAACPSGFTEDRQIIRLTDAALDSMVGIFANGGASGVEFFKYGFGIGRRTVFDEHSALSMSRALFDKDISLG